MFEAAINAATATPSGVVSLGAAYTEGTPSLMTDAQSNELSGLGTLNITRIGLNGSNSGPQAGLMLNNNLVALSTTYTVGGVNRTVGAIDLEANAFFSEIPPEVVDEAGNPVTVTETAAEQPQMNGSGRAVAC